MRPHEHYTDEELVRLLLTTQDEALRADLWVEFWSRFQRVLAITVRRRLLRRRGWADHALVEDLVHDALAKILKADFKVLQGFEFRHQFDLRGFLKVMAANVVEDYLRKEKVSPVALDDSLPDHPRFPAEVERREQLQKIEKCLQQLRGKPNFDRDYKLFWLRNREGVTAQAIFEQPDMGFNSVKGVESALLRLNRWVIQCIGGTRKKSSGGSAGGS